MLPALRQLELALGLFVLLMACTNKTNKPTPFKTPQQVPPNYINANNNLFFNQQDTIYYDRSKFSGFCFSLYPNGDTAFVKSYVNGLEEGVQKKWHNNKQLVEQRLYVAGKKEGEQATWWPNGKQKMLGTAAEDVFVGELKEWNAAGLLFKDFHYVNGQEEGSEKMWWDDGTVRANYVIHNGKRYGLLGIKICANPYDSIVKK